MLRHIAKQSLKQFSTNNNPTKIIPNIQSSQPQQSSQPTPQTQFYNQLKTDHMKQLLNSPTTGRQKKIRKKMRQQWIGCMIVAGVFYINSEDIVTGTWFTDNMFIDTRDKYPYRVQKQYKRTGKATYKYYKPDNNIQTV